MKIPLKIEFQNVTLDQIALVSHKAGDGNDSGIQETHDQKIVLPWKRTQYH